MAVREGNDYERHEWGLVVKLKGIQQWVKPFALSSRLDTREVVAEVWDDSHAGWWSGQHHYPADQILWDRRRRA